MPRTSPSLRADSTARLAQLDQQRPEWRTWLELLGLAELELDDAGWRNPVASRQSGVASPVDDPLLHRSTLAAEAGRVQQLVRRLAATAASGNVNGAESLRGFQPSPEESMRLLAAAVRQNPSAIDALADAAGIDRGALISLAHLAAFPLLQACRRVLEDRIPPAWMHGYCPICAAWPTLAERRGLDRSRRLRCGRCGAEWQVPWLCCIYCGERGHEQLGLLVPEERGERLNVETCATCRGYLKSVATLQAIPAFELLLQDLETVELDLVALDRDYYRPVESGFTLDIQLGPRGGETSC
jgi:FdhE protein